jgi:peptidoglycan/LPS O-acetylase OafA/YrhL
MQKNTWARTSSLDGLRAVAVLMVFLVHTHLFEIPGGLGVDIFFVLSGFLITRILLEEYKNQNNIDLLRFYVHRFTRLAPALVAMCVLVLIGYTVLKGGLAPDKFFNGLLALSYLSNIYMTLTGSMIDPFSHTWSLAQEEQFYLIWPFVLLLILRARVRFNRLAVGLVILALLSSATWIIFATATPYNPLLKFGGMIFGAAAAVATTNNRWASKILGYGFLAVFVAVFVLNSTGHLQRIYTTPITNLCFAFIVLMLAHKETILGKVLSLRGLVYLGRISYGFYLWHYPILIILGSFNLNPTVYAAVAFIASFAASALSFKYLEQPIIRNREKLSDWLLGRRSLKRAA